MDLFEHQHAQAAAAAEPLAVRMRPQALDGFVGQQHFIGPGKLLRRMLQADRLASAIFYGPPGTGKTTLAYLIAGATRAAFVELNATAAGVREVRAILDEARTRLEQSGQRTILFIDELHRFSKSQQDVLLRDAERGTIILIGATTENPFFSINGPLCSRSQIFEFEPLQTSDILALLERALGDRERGFGRLDVQWTDDALLHIATKADGDARRALAALEIAVGSQAAEGPIRVDLAVAEDSIQRKALRYDAHGDQHYDAASALIKSMRGSDPDAAVYWLACMLESGEDPRFIARRIAIFASEDVGNADPQALILAEAAAQATLHIGMPECQLVLSQAVTYLACAPKSRAAAQAIWNAARDVREQRTVPVPRHLRSAPIQPTPPPDGREAESDYLGVDKTYYEPGPCGYETTMREFLQRHRTFRQDDTAP